MQIEASLYVEWLKKIANALLTEAVARKQGEPAGGGA